MPMYRINEFAKLVGRSVKTLQRWDNEGKLVAHRTPSNQRVYTEQQLNEYKGLTATKVSKVIGYVRVSSHSQKDDLKSQKDFVSTFCFNAGKAVDEIYEDVGSGLNYKRKNFNKLLCEVERGEVKEIVIGHKDRLIRFGYEWFDDFCKRHGCKITVINSEKVSPNEELVKDLISIIHVFSCRIYGLRKYKKTIKEEKFDS